MANLSMDLRSLDSLRGEAAKGNTRSGIKEAAKQLESLFMQELMKSMRATTMDSGMMNNAGTEMGTSMLDTQLAGQMTGLPGGLGDMILKQLERQVGKVAGQGDGASGVSSPFSHTISRQVSQLNRPASAASASVAGVASSATPAELAKMTPSQRFVVQHRQAAEAAEASTGIPSEHILGQAALESGWGKREPRMPDGTSSHNLFGIKAGSSWKGKVAEVTTTEYYNGVPRKVTAKFRAYDSYEEAFKDHARLLTQSPRYSQTVAQADTAQGFAKGLQKAGYATDPAYADKLTKVINTTLRLQRTVA